MHPIKNNHRKKPSAAELTKLDNDYQTTLNQLGKNAVTAPLISSYAHLKAFYLNKIDDAVKLLEEIITLPGIADQFKAECKLELGDILILQDEVWDAALYYGQVDKDFKHDAIGRKQNSAMHDCLIISENLNGLLLN